MLDIDNLFHPVLSYKAMPTCVYSLDITYQIPHSYMVFIIFAIHIVSNGLLHPQSGLIISFARASPISG